MAIARGTVPVYFIMLYVLGSGVDKKVTNPPPDSLDGARCIIAASVRTYGESEIVIRVVREFYGNP